MKYGRLIVCIVLHEKIFSYREIDYNFLKFFFFSLMLVRKNDINRKTKAQILISAETNNFIQTKTIQKIKLRKRVDPAIAI